MRVLSVQRGPSVDEQEPEALHSPLPWSESWCAPLSESSIHPRLHLRHCSIFLLIISDWSRSDHGFRPDLYLGEVMLYVEEQKELDPRCSGGPGLKVGQVLKRTWSTSYSMIRPY